MKHILRYVPLFLLLLSACDDTPQGSLTKENVIVGTGEMGTLGKTWEVHYIGRLQGKVQKDSTVFESTYTDNKPFTFVYDGSLYPDGFEIGIDSMKVGGKRKIYIPYHLGFGTKGTKDADGKWLVKPKQDIMFEVELLSLPVLKTTDTVLGNGTLADANKLVNITYKGNLKGSTTIFDQNTTGFSFRLQGNTVIPGFAQGVTGMRVGGTRRIIIPPHLAYGSRAAGCNATTGACVIPANATLEFDVTLLSAE